MPQRRSTLETCEGIALADLIARYYRHEIGRLMQQAEHWAENGAPLAVHHRVTKADNYYQIVVLFERFRQWNKNPFEVMRDTLARGHMKPPGTWPPTMTIHRYRDPVFVTNALQKNIIANKLHSDDLLGALRIAVSHIEHMAAWIGEQNAGYSFESLGEDMPGIRGAIAKANGPQTPEAEQR